MNELIIIIIFQKLKIVKKKGTSLLERGLLEKRISTFFRDWRGHI